MGARAELHTRRLATEQRWGTATRFVLVAGIAALVLLPGLARAPALHAPTLAATLGTAITCGALAAAWLMHSRFADSQRLRDLLAIAAVGTLGLMTLCARVLPALVSARAGASPVAVALWGQLIVAGLFAGA